MSTRDQAIRSAQALVDDGRFVSELAELVARPTESQDPARANEMQRYLSDLLMPRLVAAGFDSEIHPNRYGNPFLVARRIEDPHLPTILGYGHGDVTRGQEGAWHADGAPLVLRHDQDRL